MRKRRSPVTRIGLLVLGVLLICLTPVVGPIPGPGGILVFGAGLMLVLRNSGWARKRFARFTRHWPRVGHYSDMALRRRSFRRRQQRAKDEAAASAEAELLGFPQESR